MYSMGLSLLPSLLWGTLLCLILHTSQRRASVGIGEELAHALALERRRKLSAERSENPQRANPRRAIASILGCSEFGIDCHILKVSSAAMNIEVPLPMPVGEQINVAWGDEFFIGAVNYSGIQQGRHVVGLQVISSNQE
jgi:hypothetical protein